MGRTKQVAKKWLLPLRGKLAKLQKNPDLITSTPLSSSGGNRRPISQASPSKVLRKSASRSRVSSAASQSSSGAAQRKKRWRPRALQQIRQLQNTTHVLIPKLPFLRVVKEVLQQEEQTRRDDGYALRPGHYLTDLRFQGAALACLQEACELHLTQFFNDAYSCALHAKRVTLFVKDMQLARKIRGRLDPMNP